MHCVWYGNPHSSSQCLYIYIAPTRGVVVPRAEASLEEKSHIIGVLVDFVAVVELYSEKSAVITDAFGRSE